MGGEGRACLQSYTFSMDSSFHSSGLQLAACVEEVEAAGEIVLARFEAMWPARMPSMMCWSQYLCGALPLRARDPPHVVHVGGSRSAIAMPREAARYSRATRQRRR